jgi:hypothetical protein
MEDQYVKVSDTSIGIVKTETVDMATLIATRDNLQAQLDATNAMIATAQSLGVTQTAP